MNLVARAPSSPSPRSTQTAEYARPDLAASSSFFSDEELDSVLNAPPSEDGPPPQTPEVSAEARALARMLGSQYAEVIAHYAVDALMGRNSRHAPKLRQIVKSFRKLATEMNDHELLQLYEQLGELIETFTTSSTHERRLSASRKLRDWVMAFADLVGDEAAWKLRRLVVFRKGVHPLISHIREIRGIGDKRLERLYSAGLLTTDSLVDADPSELSQIVGIPTRLARHVVEACRRFAEHQRHIVVASFKSAVDDLKQSFGDVDFDNEDNVRLVAELRETMGALQSQLREVEGKWKARTTSM